MTDEIKGQIFVNREEAERMCPGVTAARTAFARTADQLREEGHSASATISALVDVILAVAEAYSLSKDERLALSKMIGFAMISGAAGRKENGPPVH